MSKIYNSFSSAIVLLIMMGCMTATKTLVSNQGEFTPEFNVLEERSWIAYNPIQLYQDETYLYIYFSYTSDFDGVFSLFNPPDGTAFMLKGDVIGGDGGIIERIEKNKLKGIEGITMLLFPGDFSSGSERTGLFINIESIIWGSIPEIPMGKFQEKESISESSKDHGVIKEIVHEEVDIAEIDLEFREALQEKIANINIESNGEEEIQSLFGTPGKRNYFANGQRMTLQYPDKFYPIINTQTGRIDELRFHNPGYVNSEGIHVGSSLDNVIDAYGKPDNIIESEKLNGDRQTRVLYNFPQFSYYLIQDRNIRFFFDEFNNVSAMYLLSPNFINE